jgi:hypothetical protein
MAQIRAKITNGSIQAPRFLEHLQIFEGKEVVIQIDKAPLKRSLAQNRYYRKVVVGAFHKLWKEVVAYEDPKTGEDVKGLTTEMTHEMLKVNFLPITIVSPSGQRIKSSRSTTDLSTSEMMDFIDACRNYYNQQTGEYIEPPDFY